MFRICSTALAVALFFTAGASLSAAVGHDHDHGHHGHGTMTELGSLVLGPVSVKIAGAGAPVIGQEWHVTVELPAGSAAPKAIRVWVGVESGRGSEKAKARGEADHPGAYEAHVDVPAPLPEGSQLWVSLEPATGDNVKGSLPLPASVEKPAVPAGHGAHDDHEH